MNRGDRLDVVLDVFVEGGAYRVVMEACTGLA